VTTPATIPETTAPPERADGVGLTLDPVTLEDFLDQHWDRKPLLVARGEQGRFDSILSRDDVQRLVCETGIRSPAFRLVKDGEQLPLRDYTVDVPWRPGSFSAMAQVDRVAEEFADGATIVLQALHLHWRPAAVYCRALEATLGCPAQANAYFTPAAARGFDVHHDTHDVLVLQVAGSKRWRWYEPVRELALKSQKWSAEQDEPGPPVADVTLEPGDTLYLPRGWPHEAFTSDADSLHLTVGLHPATRMDALRAALDDCADDVEFRRALGEDGELPPHLLERLAARLGREQVAERMRRRFVAGRRPILDRQLDQVGALSRLTVDDLVERRPTVIAELELEGDIATLVFEGKEVVFPPAACAAVRALHTGGEPFRATDLPGPLDEPSRLVLIRRLVREGYLRVA
jgi:bifunctional lysine-specific demethylase and histidyl-hydroxylase NO66